MVAYIAGMDMDDQARQLAEEYKLVRKFAASKVYSKYRGFLTTLPQSVRPFTAEDFNQWALEGVLILGGLMPGSFSGRLGEYLEGPSPQGYIQHTVDLYVTSKAQDALRASRAVKRDYGRVPAYLDTPIGDQGQTLADVLAPRGVETSGTALPEVAKRYPILWMTAVQRVPDSRARVHLGLNQAEFSRQRAGEARRLHEWAVRYRRVEKDTKAPTAPPGCPYGDAQCTGNHSAGRSPKAEVCPAAWTRMTQRHKATRGKVA